MEGFVKGRRREKPRLDRVFVRLGQALAVYLITRQEVIVGIDHLGDPHRRTEHIVAVTVLRLRTPFRAIAEIHTRLSDLRQILVNDGCSVAKYNTP
jgi:hypothetical protein